MTLWNTSAHALSHNHRSPLPSLVLSTLAASLLLVFIGAFSACSGTAQADSPAAVVAPAKTFPKDKVVDAVPVVVPDMIVVTGTVQPFDRSDLVPDISGKIIEVMVDRGSKVAAGDPLLRLDTRTAALSEREARANVAALKAQQRLADDTCRRSKELLDKGAITAAEYDRDLSACVQARENVSAANARLGKAGQSLADGVIRAPFAGTIAERWVSLGEWASPQGRLFTLVDDHALRADLSLSEAASIHAKLGAAVEVMPVADRSHPVNGSISRIGVEVDPKTRGLLVEVALPTSADATLRPGMFVEARIAVGERALPAVPKTALVKRGSTWRAFAVVGARLEERVVQLGPDTADGRATIVRGISAGDQLASHIDDTVSDGISVK